MSEQLWDLLMEQLARAPAVKLTTLCVGCWYQLHPCTPFPAQATSMLCSTCTTQTRATYHHDHVNGAMRSQSFVPGEPI